MSRITCLLAVAAACVLAATRSAPCADWLGGVAQQQFQSDLVPAGADGPEYVVHHASTAGTLEWSPNENLKLRLTMGTTTSSLEEPISSGSETGFYTLFGVSLETPLSDPTAGGLVLDFSYSLGRNDLESNEYDYDRWHLLVGYVFGGGDRARPYAGISYNLYSSELTGAGPDMEFENKDPISLVAGVRARSGTFMGLAEASVLGELGVRLSLLFGF